MRTLQAVLIGSSLALAVPAVAFAHGTEERGQTATLSDLPSQVRSTFESEASGGSVEELRKETMKDGRTVYRGEVVKNGKGTDLEVSEGGKVVHRGKTHDESSEKGEHK